MSVQRDIDGGGGIQNSTDPAMDALNTAIDAAANFNQFSAIIEQIVEELGVRHAEMVTESQRAVAEKRDEAIRQIEREKNEALNAIRAATSGSLYQPAEHNVNRGRLTITED